MTAEPSWMSVDAAAVRMQVSPRTLLYWVHIGQRPAVRVRTCVRVLVRPLNVEEVPPIVTGAWLARWLGVSQRTIRREHRAGALPFRSPAAGGSRWMPRRDLLAWLDEQTDGWRA